MFRCYKRDWEDYIENCGFSDEELEIIALLRKEWYQVDIAAETKFSLSKVKRRMKTIYLKIADYESNKYQKTLILAAKEKALAGNNKEVIAILNVLLKE